MSSIKRHFEDQEQKRQIAIEIALRVGLLTKCEYHDEIIDPLENNHEEAYKLANSLITKEDALVNPFNGNRKELTDMLSSITEEFGDQCSFCHKWDND